jgi:fumarate reductase subunit D
MKTPMEVLLMELVKHIDCIDSKNEQRRMLNMEQRVLGMLFLLNQCEMITEEERFRVMSVLNSVRYGGIKAFDPYMEAISKVKR